ncbi:MAG: DUF4861 family protein, partial [Bacteroidales bacterium]|nr:DUF4861 family protein [Bacteroidales bacterium]
NHAFAVTPDINNTFEYMICTAWSEGTKLNNKEDFTKYVEMMAEEFNNPIQTSFVKIEDHPNPPPPPAPFGGRSSRFE